MRRRTIRRTIRRSTMKNTTIKQSTINQSTMKKKLISIATIGLLTLSMLAGCGKSTTPEAASTQQETQVSTEAEATETASEEVTIEEGSIEATTQTEVSGRAAQDRAGNDIVIPDNINKIISMSPSTTRFLIDLGLADKIVAIDTNSYAYLDSLPADVQQFDMMTPDNEALIALEPDIIFTSGMSSLGGEDVFQSARNAGICVFDVPSSNSFEDIAKDLEAIGDAVGCSNKASEIIDEFNSKYDEIKKIGEGITEKKTILFEISLPSSDYPSIYTFGSGTYLDEMITAIGAENVTGDQESWISISEEAAIAMNPDVIITNVNYIDDATGVIMSSKGWEEVTAIKNSAVYYIDADASNQPNNHVIDALIQMAKLVYPDQFTEFDDPFASPGDAE